MKYRKQRKRTKNPFLVNLVLNWAGETYIVKGTIAKTGQGTLKGTLIRYSGRTVVAVCSFNISGR